MIQTTMLHNALHNKMLHSAAVPASLAYPFFKGSYIFLRYYNIFIDRR